MENMHAIPKLTFKAQTMEDILYEMFVGGGEGGVGKGNLPWSSGGKGVAMVPWMQLQVLGLPI